MTRNLYAAGRREVHDRMGEDPHVAGLLPERRVGRRDPAAETASAHRGETRVRTWSERSSSNFICIFDVPVTGRITAWTDTARAGGSSAFWHTNERSWSLADVGEGDDWPNAVPDPTASAHATAAPTPSKRLLDMRKYQQIAAPKVAPREPGGAT